MQRGADNRQQHTEPDSNIDVDYIMPRVCFYHTTPIILFNLLVHLPGSIYDTAVPTLYNVYLVACILQYYSTISTHLLNYIHNLFISASKYTYSQSPKTLN